MDFARIKQAAAGRIVEILARVGNVPQCILDDPRAEHPCPKCGGTTRCRLIDQEAGAVRCSHCHATRCGDYIATVQWMRGFGGYVETMRAIGEYLGVAQARAPTVFSTYMDARAAYDRQLGPVGAQPFRHWTYHDRDGNEVAYVVRYNLPTECGQKQQKTFRPIHRTPAGLVLGDPPTWPIYNLQGLLASTGPVYVVEGEKACDRAKRHLTAITSAHGSGAAHKTDWTPLAGRDVVLLPDNDSAGQKYVADCISEWSKLDPKPTVRVVQLPGLPETGDFDDFIAARQDQPAEQILAEIESLVAAAPPVNLQPTPTREKPVLRNFEWITEENYKGEEKEKRQALPAETILRDMRTITGGWPFRVGDSMFIHTNETVDWLTSQAHLFGWLHSLATVEWHTGDQYITKPEFHAEVQRSSTVFDSIEQLPHEPTIERHYYLCGDVGCGSGNHLVGLLNRFCPASELDRDLILTMFLTLLWGGRAGARPCFVVTSDEGRGAGKSKLAQMFSLLAGGAIDLTPNEDIGQIKTRLLSPNALDRRIALIDNLKSHKFSWGDLEGLITSAEINGRRNYVGDASRPNTLVWLMTLNGASLSNDMAQRSVILKLRRPEQMGDWEDTTAAYILEHRMKIIGDLLGILRNSPHAQFNSFTRWAAWERDVLSRVPSAIDAQQEILRRQHESDVDQEEDQIVEDFIRNKLYALGYDVERQKIHIPARVMNKWWCEASNDRKSTVATSRIMRQSCKEGKTREIQLVTHGSYGRGFLWFPADAPQTEHVRLDLEERIERSCTKDYGQKF